MRQTLVVNVIADAYSARLNIHQCMGLSTRDSNQIKQYCLDCRALLWGWAMGGAGSYRTLGARIT